MTGCGNFRRETVHVPLSLAPAPHLKPHLLLDHLIISFPQCDTASSSSPSQIRSNYSSLHRRCCHVALDYFKATAWNMHRGRVRVRGGCGEGVGSHQKNSCYHWTVFEGTVWFGDEVTCGFDIHLDYSSEKKNIFFTLYHWLVKQNPWTIISMI